MAARSPSVTLTAHRVRGRDGPPPGEDAPVAAPPSRRAVRERRRRAKRLVVLVAAVLVAVLYAGPVRSYLDARAAETQARSDVTRLRAEQARLQTTLRSLHSNAAVIALARESGWIFPGETPYVIPHN
jgi:cell division protein FtsB